MSGRHHYSLVACVSVASLSMLWGSLIAMAAVDCNYDTPQAQKLCQDPATPCYPYNQAAEGEEADYVCPSIYTKTVMVIPGCRGNGACDTHCDSDNVTFCRQSRVCQEKSGTSGTDLECIDGGASGAPQVTTFYYSDSECDDFCF